jgi:hypothetical protein
MADRSKEEEFYYLLTEGSEHLQAGRIEEARQHFERALVHNPRSEQGLNLLGLALFRLGQLERAKQIFADLVHHNPIEPSLRLNLAMVFLKQGKLDDAYIELERVLELNPDHPRATSYMGLVLEKKGQLERAADFYERAGNKKRADEIRAFRPTQTGTFPIPNLAAMGVQQAPTSTAPGPAAMRAAATSTTPPAPSPSHSSASAPAAAPSSTSPPPRPPARAPSAMMQAASVPPGASTMPGPSAAPPRTTTLPGTSVPSPSMPTVSMVGVSQPPTTPPTTTPPTTTPPTTTPPTTTPPTTTPPTTTPPTTTPPTTTPPTTTPPAAPPPVATAAVVPVATRREAGSGLGLAGPSPADVRQSRTDVLELALARLDQHAVDGTSLAQAEKSQLVVPIDELGYVRTDLITSVSGAFELEVVNRRYRGKRTDSLFGGTDAAIVALMGRGSAVLHLGELLPTALTLTSEEVYLVESAVMSFSSGLIWENGRLPSESDRDLDIVHLRGSGRVIVGTGAPLVVLPVKAGAPVLIHAQRLLGWTGQLVPYRAPLPGLPEQARRVPVVRFEGTGSVLAS